jgi:hypothetical protein
MVAVGLTALESERGRINDLNVYPVPDGDTGTNLCLTVRAILDELESDDGGGLAEVAAAITRGSLMGARGNSGVILSQIVRGACETIAAAGTVDATIVRQALAEASDAAYRAVQQPVEGTMLTVIRMMSEALLTVPAGASLADLLRVAGQAGKEAVEATPGQLEVLRRAGVVDAGGYGLLVLFEGLAGSVAGDSRASRPAVRTLLPAEGDSHGRALPGLPDDIDEAGDYRYCTSFLLTGESLDRGGLERFVSEQGDSWLVVGDGAMVKVHVHTDHPGTVLGYASAWGTVSAVEVNDMRVQTRERTARLKRRAEGSGVVAVVAGEGNKSIFRELGCEGIVDGGQSMNPSAAEILAEIDASPAAEVIVLPNNQNIVLTAEQAAAMSERVVEVVPTLSLPAGLSAMIVFDPQLPAAANGAAMRVALGGVRSAEVTFAVRDSEIDGVVVTKGQVLGLVDGHVLTVGDDVRTVFAALLTEFGESGVEVLTVLTSLNGCKVTVADLEAIAGETIPKAEVEFREGGQPLYPILVGAE